MKTIVYQSYRTTDVAPWICRCLESVSGWAYAKGWDYRFFGDEIFDLAPGWYRDKAAEQLVVVTDLCRLIIARDLLTEGYERVIWMDADVLVFDPDGLDINITQGFAFGVETWIQDNGKGKLKVFYNVHNAICVFTKGNSFLDFYIDACLSIVKRTEGPMVAQLVGPKFLTALNNIVGFELIWQVGAFSPLLLRDIAEGGGAALALHNEKAKGAPKAANLCASQENVVNPDIYEKSCARLLEKCGRSLFE